jgi:apolipoprotein N-acyltransferase
MATGSEYISGLVSPNGSFGALGYALVDVLPLLQTASLAGVAGLTFLAAVVPAALAVSWVKPRDVTATAAWAVPVVPALLFGLWQLAQPSGASIRIALLSDDRQAGRVIDNPDTNAEIAAGFARQIAEAAAQNPAAIVLPEKIMAAGTELESSPDSVIVAGLDGPAPKQGRLNIAALYRLNLPGQTYLKKRMVPGLEEAYVSGDTELFTLIKGQKAGVAICKDMDFAGDLRRYGQRNVALMLVPAWDFEADAYLHGRMAVVRGVENGFAVARSASQGLMTLSDSKGRIIAEARTAQRPMMLVGDLPGGRGGTMYSRFGDVLAQAATAAWLCLLAMLFWRRRHLS